MRVSISCAWPTQPLPPWRTGSGFVFQAGEHGQSERMPMRHSTAYLRLASVESGDGDYVHPRRSAGCVSEEMGDLAVAQRELYHDLLVSEGSPDVRKRHCSWRDPRGRHGPLQQPRGDQPDSRRPHQRVPSTDALTCP